jgi:hypothetical protein
MRQALPRYAANPLQRFLNSLKGDSRLLHLCMRGIGVLTHMPGIFEAVMQDSPPKDQAQLNADLAESKKEAELCENERTTGFPLLHAHAFVAAWGAFEAAVEDMLVGILVNEPETVKQEAFAKIRVPLADFEAKDKEERMRFLVAELGRNLGRKNGVEAFEGLLQFFNLSGPVNDHDRKLIWQMHHLRNVIVHRASLADRRLVEACPWLHLKINDPVIISHKELGLCTGALCSYALTITHRLGDRYEVNTHELIRQAGITESQPPPAPES